MSQKIILLTTVVSFAIFLFVMIPITPVESGLFFKGCGEKPGIFQLATRMEVPLNVMETIQESGNGPKARCKIPFNIVCLPGGATCEFDNQCCSKTCEVDACLAKESEEVEEVEEVVEQQR